MKKENPLTSLYRRDGTKTVLASLISIAIGLGLGALIVIIVAAFNDNITMKAGWEGTQLVLFGLFCTGRDAAGQLTFGFNGANIGNMLFRATPILMTGLSVAVADRKSVV